MQPETPPGPAVPVGPPGTDPTTPPGPAVPVGPPGTEPVTPPGPAVPVGPPGTVPVTPPGPAAPPGPPGMDPAAPSGPAAPAAPPGTPPVTPPGPAVHGDPSGFWQMGSLVASPPSSVAWPSALGAPAIATAAKPASTPVTHLLALIRIVPSIRTDRAGDCTKSRRPHAGVVSKVNRFVVSSDPRRNTRPNKINARVDSHAGSCACWAQPAKKGIVHPTHRPAHRTPWSSTRFSRWPGR